MIHAFTYAHAPGTGCNSAAQDAILGEHDLGREIEHYQHLRSPFLILFQLVPRSASPNYPLSYLLVS